MPCISSGIAVAYQLGRGTGAVGVDAASPRARGGQNDVAEREAG